MTHIQSKYHGVEAIRSHDKIFRIYKDQEIYVEFYNIEHGQKFLEFLRKQENDKSHNNTSTD